MAQWNVGVEALVVATGASGMAAARAFVARIAGFVPVVRRVV